MVFQKQFLLEDRFMQLKAKFLTVAYRALYYVSSSPFFTVLSTDRFTLVILFS